MRRKAGFFVLGVVFCLTVAVWISVYDLARAAPVEVSFLDVGEGDAIFININGLYQILIDGGPGKKILQELPQVFAFGDRTIDVVISTHPDRDHTEGLISVLKNYGVDYAVWSGLEKKTLVFEEWKRMVQEAQEIKIVGAGDKIFFNSAELVILSAGSGQGLEDTNAGSIVARLKKEGISFLFTADIYKEQEQELLKRDISSHVLKVAHHGSRSSSSQEFLNKVFPEIAVISAGRNNPYHHPHEEVLQQLKALGIKIMRTDEQKTVQVLSDGEYLVINN